MKIQFWEETYKNDNIYTFGSEPNRTLIEFENMFDKLGNILDVGCGDGKNSLYLADHGFENIEAFDSSENAINKLIRLKTRNNLHVKAFVEDLCNYHFEKVYNLIFSFGTLHFVKKSEWYKFILNAKEYTAVGGFHVIQIFTDIVPASFDIVPYAVGIASDGEIKTLYADWEILQFKSYTFEEEHPGVPKHLHSSNKIVAQRIK